MTNYQLPTTNYQLPTTNTLILYLLMIVFNHSAYSQKASSSEINTTPNGILENVFDQSGKKYTMSELLIENSASVLTTCSSTSYFNLYFEAGSGMENINNPVHNARRAVVCKVFEDVSNFINSPLTATGNKVNIWVRNINNVFNAPNGILGLASGFYSVPSSQIIGGIANNEIWKTIHTGVDSYINTTVPLTVLGGGNNQSGIFFHGIITFNFNTTNTPAINFNTDLSIYSISLGEFDLYSAVLHEVTHALGFASLINQDGNSIFGPNFKYYSRYDRCLKTNNASLFLLTSTACSTMYDYIFNSGLTANVLRPNPTAIACNGITQCNDAIKFVGTTTVPVYTPNCFNPIGSLGHFEDTHFPTCNTTNPIYGNDNYFLMCNAGNSGMIRRYLKPEERNALCDIGYNVKTTFGSASVKITPTSFGPFNYGGTVCNGIIVAGINDGINLAGSYTFIGNANTNIVINGSAILLNDTNAAGFECMQDLTATTTNPTNLSATSGTSLTSINFNSNLAGLHLLRYVPTNGLQNGNITYVYVYVTPIISGCTTAPSTCNLLNNGDFEANNVDITQLIDFNFNKVCEWGKVNPLAGMALYTEYFLQNTATQQRNVPCNEFGFENDKIPTKKAFAGILSYSFSNGAHTSGILSTKLSSVLTPSTSYQIKFDVSQADFYKFRNYGLQAFVSSIKPNQILTGLITNPQLASGILISDTIVSNNFNGWNTVVLTFTTTAFQNNLEYLYLGILNNAVSSLGATLNNVTNCNNTLNFSPQNGSFYYIDNVSLIATGGAILDLPATICTYQSLTDLTTFLAAAPTNGIFTGPGITLSGGIYSFSAATTTIGVHLINYTYNNNLGCSITLSDTIIVSNTSSNSTPIDAIDDNFSSMPINTVTGGVTTSVYANDIYNSAPSSITSLLNVNFTLVAPISVPGAIINNLGLISIPPGTPTGIYTLTYQLSVVGNCTSSDKATIQILIISANTPTIVTGIRANNTVNNVELQSTGKLIIAGDFTTYNNFSKPNLARLNTNLTLDPTFIPSGNQGAMDIAIQSDNKIVIATWSNANFGGTSKGICRLLPNGNLDTTFNAGGPGITGRPGITNEYAYTVVIQPDNKILLGGDFILYNGRELHGIARINPDGSRDTSFIAATFNKFYRGIVTGITVQPDGKILLLGFFSPNTVGTTTKNIVRLNNDGSIDTIFTAGDTIGSTLYTNLGTTLFSPISKAVLQPDGKIIIAGTFDKYNGTNVRCLARLTSTGTIDTSFNTTIGVERAINELVLEPITNNLLVGGEFTQFGSTTVKKLIRLTNTGTLDTTFSIGTGTTDSSFTTNPFSTNFIKAIKQQPDGKLIIGGKFTTFNGLSASNITRIFGTAGAQSRSSIVQLNSEPEINTNFNTNVIVYPNPSSTVFDIDLTQVDQQFIEVTVYNILGEKVFSKEIKPQSINSINLSHLAAGYYLAQLHNENDFITVKLIKN